MYQTMSLPLSVRKLVLVNSKLHFLLHGHVHVVSLLCEITGSPSQLITYMPTLKGIHSHITKVLSAILAQRPLHDEKSSCCYVNYSHSTYMSSRCSKEKVQIERHYRGRVGGGGEESWKEGDEWDDWRQRERAKQWEREVDFKLHGGSCQKP